MIEFQVFFESTEVCKTVLTKKTIRIGRSEDNDLVLANPHVSRLEAIIEQDGDTMRLLDKSKNGILMDSRRVAESTILPSKCTLDIYPFRIECLSYSEDETIPIPKATPSSHPASAPRAASAMQAKAQTAHFSGLIGESQAMLDLYQLIQDVATTPATALIQGEHGTGKELVARALHSASQRRNKMFVPVNCAAIPLDLIESELFGYEKGAFTGAQATKSGKIEEAIGGTIFLDEVGELSMTAQAKLLRFLQEKAIMRLGSAREVPVDVRVVVATNRDLAKATSQGDFREDLFYRLKVVQLRLPPLRERAEDIPMLAHHFLKKGSSELGLNHEPIITDDAMEHLKASPWPGNVRQLQNTLYSACLRSRTSGVIDKAILLQDTTPQTPLETHQESAPLDALNKEALLQVLIQQQWDTTKAASVLKVSRGTIYYKMKKYNIEPPRPSSRSNQ